MEANTISLIWEKFRTITISVLLLNYLPKIGKPDAKSFVVYVLQVSNAILI
jgi:hypothetical protein